MALAHATIEWDPSVARAGLRRLRAAEGDHRVTMRIVTPTSVTEWGGVGTHTLVSHDVAPALSPIRVRGNGQVYTRRPARVGAWRPSVSF